MKIAVLGATGKTGREIVQHALDKGWQVKALVRDPDKMTGLVQQHEKLHVQKVDLSQEDELATAMTGVDAVLSSLGGRGGVFAPCSVYSDSILHIISAMKKAGIKRLVCITSWGIKHAEGLPWFMAWVVKPIFLRNVHPDMVKMEDYLANECPDINFTVVRPPRLTEQPASNKEIQTREGQCVSNVDLSLSRIDLAKFMLHCLSTDSFNRKMVAIGVSK